MGPKIQISSGEKPNLLNCEKSTKSTELHVLHGSPISTILSDFRTDADLGSKIRI